MAKLKISEDELLVLSMGIVRVWNVIGYDCMELGDLKNNGALELCMDADRLEMYGSKEAQAVVDRVCSEGAFSLLLNRLSKTIKLA